MDQTTLKLLQSQVNGIQSQLETNNSLINRLTNVVANNNRVIETLTNTPADTEQRNELKRINNLHNNVIKKTKTNNINLKVQLDGIAEQLKKTPIKILSEYISDKLKSMKKSGGGMVLPIATQNRINDQLRRRPK